MRVLGVHDGHNAAAALMESGTIVAAVQEERIVREKNRGGLPVNAIREVLEISKLKPTDVSYVALGGQAYDGFISRNDVLNRYDAELQNQRRMATRLRSRVRDITVLRRVRAMLRDNGSAREQQSSLIQALGFRREQIRVVDHHLAHAAAAYYGYGRYGVPVLVLTCDGAGDGLCASVNIGEHGRLTRIAAIPEGESVGRLYAMMTYLMGMVPLEHEYKIMGLAPYGGGRAAERVFQHLGEIFEVDQKKPLGWQRRRGVPAVFYLWDALEALMRCERFDHIAAGLQRFVEVFVSSWVKRCVNETGIRRVALSGGVFMNVKLNKIILELEEIEDLFVFPSCGDETNAIGAAYQAYAEEKQKAGEETNIAPLGSLYWGKGFVDADVEEALKNYAFKSKVTWRYSQCIAKEAAALLAAGHIVARAKGRMEFGARALGNRSILARSDSTQHVRIINEMIKCRDFWMPFAPSILAESASRYTLKPKPMPAPYMVMTFDSRESEREAVGAVVHPNDGTMRPQEVSASTNPDYYELLSEYQARTRHGIILNTSFNLHGYPIVYSPADALRVFDDSGLRYLALGEFLVRKE